MLKDREPRLGANGEQLPELPYHDATERLNAAFDKSPFTSREIAQRMGFDDTRMQGVKYPGWSYR